MVEIAPYAEDKIEDVLRIYNAVTVFTPYCYPLTEEVFREAVVSNPLFRADGFAIAYSGGVPQGFIHCGVFEPTCHENTGAIYLFLASDRIVCHRLLDTAVEFFAERGVTTCYALCPESHSGRFYAGIHIGYEVSLWQGFYPVVAAFERSPIFDRAREGFIMSMDMDTQPEQAEASIDVTIEVERQPDTGSLYTNATVLARVGGEEAGRCSFHLLKRLSDHLGKGIGQITMGVNERYRRKGIGLAILTRAHRELYNIGARRMLLGTNYQLYPAIKLYEKAGYRQEPINRVNYWGYLGSTQETAPPAQ